jgi:hypothetical protein
LGPRGVAALTTTGVEPADLMIDATPISTWDSVETRVNTLRALLAELAHRSRPLTDLQIRTSPRSSACWQ